MSEFFQFAIIGLGVGALYVLASQGLVIIYRGSGILNLAHGAIGLSGAYVYAELRTRHGWAVPLAFVAGVLFAAVLGALAHLVVMRQLRRASPLARVVATLGILLILQSVVVLRYGGRVTYVPQILPQSTYSLGGGVRIGADRIILVGIAIVFTAVLWWLYHRVRFGLVTSAVAENEFSAAALGWSPDVVATSNWALGSALAGSTGILIAPIVTLQVGEMTSLLLASLATAMVAAFRSFPLVLVAGVGIGVAQALTQHYVRSVSGLSDALPFAVIVVFLVARGRSLPLRDYLLQRLPALGSGRIRPWAVVLGAGAAAAVILTTSTAWVAALTVTLGTGLVLLSIIVITGYTGQLSLAQFAFAGFGALVAGQLISSAGFPVTLAVPLGVLAAVPLGFLFALPSLRTRGITLAVVTLGLGAAVQALVFNNGRFTGGLYGTNIGTVNVFGWAIDGVNHPRRYAFAVLIAFTVAALLVANVRRSTVGLRLVSVRTNERAAAALGISVRGVKVYAFGLAAGIAAMGGIALSFTTNSVLYTSGFDPFSSIAAVAYSVIGGLGFIFGAVVGATLAPGSLGTPITNSLPGGIDRYLPLAGGVFVVLLMLGNQDGSVKETLRQLRWVGARLSSAMPGAAGRAAARRPGEVMPTAGSTVSKRVEPRTLTLDGVSVRYGATLALNDVSFEVHPGEVVGLIGPNGAGKTTLIDAVTGFAPLSRGDVRLGGESITGLSAERRARTGISRSFQSLELFEDSTVLDNIRSARDRHDWLSYLTDLVVPRRPPLPPDVAGIVREFGLDEELDVEAQALTFGKRHLLSIARAVAALPSVLLLDEPAAGLGDAESEELVDVVRRLARDWGMAVLLIEHDMNFIMALADRLVVLDFGSVIAEGDGEAIRGNPAVLAAYLGEDDDDDPDEEPAASARSADPVGYADSLSSGSGRQEVEP